MTVRERARKLYRKFMGRGADLTLRLTVPDDYGSRRLVMLGEAVAIEYRSAIEHDDGQLANYRHEFQPGSVLAATPGGVGSLVVLGPIRVTDQGIVG